jgi:hypothetical protein
MGAPMSEEVAKLLQDGQTAKDFVMAILKSRSSADRQGRVAVTIDGIKKIYKPVSAIHRH